MRATIRQIAHEAGVSNVTVSNVLRGLESRASAETRERVLAAAQKLNYIPVRPPTAQNRHVETRVVTLVPEHKDVLHELDLFTYQGVVEGARRHGYSVMTMLCHEEDQAKGYEPLRFLDRSSDGFIFTVTLQEHWTRVLDIVSQNQMPSVVCYNRNVPQGVAWVDVDNGAAMRQAVEHLVARGHTRIAYVGGPSDNFNADERQREWDAAMRQHGLEAGENFIVQNVRDEDAQNNENLAKVTRMGVTAAVCFNDVLALALWDIIEAQGGSVPHDLSLIGMDNRATAEARGLSSIAHSFADVGRLAMDTWVELKNGADAALCSKLAPVQLIARDSVQTFNSTSDLWEPDSALASVLTSDLSTAFRLDKTFEQKNTHEKSPSTPR